MNGQNASAGPGPARWRNIGILAHINAGKTTLTERILFDSGRQRHLGDVDAGTATTDWQREEQARGISIEAAVTDVRWRGHLIQIIDTPGHVDFSAEVERSLRVLDGAVVVVDGVRGVEPQTESVWRMLDALGVPRLVFVNKLDRPTADFERAVETLQRRLGAVPLPLVGPLLAEDGSLRGLVDAVAGRGSAWLGPVDPGLVERVAARILDRCADLDGDLLARFVASGRVDAPDLHAAVRRLTLARTAVPVFAGSALANRGVELLLDGICRYLPSPLDRGAVFGAGPVPEAGDQLALVFKLAPGLHPRAVLARVFRGVLRPGERMEDGTGRPCELSEVHAVHADQFCPVAAAGPGAIVAVVADRALATGETLRSVGSAVTIEPIRFSEPVLRARLEPRAAEELGQLAAAARALAVTDPTLRVSVDESTGALQVAGMGELHLEIFRERLERRIGSAVRFGRPSVVRFETVAGAGDGEAEIERQLGETRIRARALVRVEPAPEQGVHFRWAVAGAVPDALRHELLHDLQGLAAAGWATGSPARDVAVEVREIGVAGPTEMVGPLLAEAAGLALRRAFEAAGPVLLEPSARFLVLVPTAFLSTVLADLRARAARIEEILPGPELSELRGRVALRGVIGYATPLRSMTQGRGTFELLPDGYAAATPA